MTRLLSLALLALFVTGCAPTNTDTLQQRTADATAAAKRDAEAITKGIGEGLARKGPVNINKASDRDLERLPGITPELADAIIAKRPYAETRDLLHKRVVQPAEYNRIRNQIVAQ